MNYFQYLRDNQEALDNLLSIAEKHEMDDTLQFLGDNAKHYISFRKHLNQNRGQEIQLSYFLENGIGYEDLHYLIYFLLTKGEQISISESLETLTYQ